MCIAVAYSLPYPYPHEIHDAERAKLVPSELPQPEQKSNTEEALIPRLIPSEPKSDPLPLGPDQPSLQNPEVSFFNFAF